MSSTEQRPVCDQTADEFFLSLNGFDEIAIARAFGQDISDMVNQEQPDRARPFMFIRALVFVHKRRTSEPKIKDAQAFDQAMRMPQAELQEYFADDEADDLDPDDPDTDQGKDDTLSG